MPERPEFPSQNVPGVVSKCSACRFRRFAAARLPVSHTGHRLGSPPASKGFSHVFFENSRPRADHPPIPRFLESDTLLIASSSAAMPHCLRGLPAGGLGGLWRRRLGSLVIVRLEFDLRVSFFDVPTESEVEGAAEHSRACHGGSCQSMSRKHADAIPISQKTRCLGDE
ncbi:hypothetical protein VFPFJ_00553 [Purpureocillium lilacinum]|uniref:Uncharacterized protein n=1 Tax=Purpureocillium lilacinum TaxID=33203 RepID=A0A179HWN5_PURLI|nr:hypothetical protein VFPFJ_00553 [Purpureocillium lilacinum]OAQ94444.1 hypothetical protein VFPFJ_00553 [Purpureocillium lilacinum]